MKARDDGPRLDRWLFALGLAAPILLAVFVFHDAVNLPVGDEWWWVLLLDKERAGTLQFADLWTQHNEHRIVFPTLVMLALDRFGGYNVVREIALNVLFALLTLLALNALIRRTIPARRTAICFAFTALFVFSMSQYENWTWGFQIAWYLVNLCGVIALLLLFAGRDSYVALAAAAGCVTVASFSVSSGLDFWIAGAFVIAALRPVRRRRLAVWLICGAACFAAYLHGYSKPSYHPSTTAVFGDPAGFVDYLLTYVGTPLAVARTAAGVVPAGIAIALAAAAAFWLFFRERTDAAKRDAAVPWLGLIVFGALSAGMTAIGRFGFGVDQAFSSRYVTVSTLLWIGAFGALCVLVGGRERRDARMRRPALAAAALAFVVCYGIANVKALRTERLDKDHRLAAYVAIHDLADADDTTLSYAFPDVRAIRIWTPRLLRLSAEPPP